MYDADLAWGDDLSVGPTGDIALATGATLGQQRVIRRLLTNAGDYIWQLQYGAGLGQMVGTPASPAQIASLIRSQIFAETAVARLPEPRIDVQAIPDGTFYAYVRYADSASAGAQVLSFPVGP